jgi:PadR family transcriptional regulator, regulatory protein PadR
VPRVLQLGWGGGSTQIKQVKLISAAPSSTDQFAASDFFRHICFTKVEIMSGRLYLGELEELTLLMVALLEKDAYGVTIVEELKKQVHREISISAAHAVLHRLEEKGFVKSRMGGASQERGGRRKRLFTITAYGRNALQELRDTREVIWGLITKTSVG